MLQKIIEQKFKRFEIGRIAVPPKVGSLFFCSFFWGE